VFAALDVTLRRLGGAPTYVLTDNEKTVTVEHIAGMAVRNSQVVNWARYYGVTVYTGSSNLRGTTRSCELSGPGLRPVAP